MSPSSFNISLYYLQNKNLLIYLKLGCLLISTSFYSCWPDFSFFLCSTLHSSWYLT
ncbi:hypothetical protein ACMBCN_03465 [Candidatus Liberibacter asiaticus]|nr:hypothetical protein [Candidatus Liberibacter asiaticus]